MSKKYTFAIIGGDKRQVVVAEHLLSGGHDVRIYGMPDLSVDGIESCFTLKKAITDADIVLLPLPASRDGKTLNTDFNEYGKPVELSDIVDVCAHNKNTIILGGMLSGDFFNYACENGVKLIDFYHEESLQRKNALPSAEGAIMVAMQNTDKVFCGMRILVCGYGRIGKLIAKKSSLLGADVTVAARRDEVLCEIAMEGYRAIRFSDDNKFIDAIDTCEIIFNTVPSNVINKSIIKSIKKLPLYFEIASAPGGIDASAARDRGIRMIYAPSLPGRYAPASAGMYIYETISDLLRARGYDI